MIGRSLAAIVLTSILLAGECRAQIQSSLPPPTEGEKARAAEFEKRVDEAAQWVAKLPRLQNLTLEQRKDVTEFVVGNILFALVHEMGHATISEMGLPVLGREEDAADAYAILAMLRMQNLFSDHVLIAATTGWFLSAERDRAEGIRLAFFDEHGLDQQRAYEIVCLMIGSDPDRYAAAAEKVNMPEDRQETCPGDYSNASWSWAKSLELHRRAPDQPMQKFNVVYDPADQGRVADAAHYLRMTQLLETVAYFESEEFVWRRPITLEAKACGQPDIHWDVRTATVYLCYETVLDFADLYRGYGFTPIKAPGSATGCPPTEHPTKETSH